MKDRLRSVTHRLALALALTAGLSHAAAPPVFEVKPEAARDPWWQRATLSPRSTAVLGMSVKRLHPDWCAAEVFSAGFFGEDRAAQALALLPEGTAFVLEGSFDALGRPQTAFVGAYRRCAGEQGLFVAIVEPHPSRPRMRFLVEVPDAPSAFAALSREPDGALAVWWCAGCDSGHRIGYNKETKSFFVAGPATKR